MNVKRASVVSVDRPSAPLATVRGQGAVLRIRAFALLFAADMVCIVLAMLAAALVRSVIYGGSVSPVALAILLPLYAGAALVSHAYSLVYLEHPASAVWAGVKAMALAVGAVILVGFGLKTTENFSRFTLTLGSGFAVILISVCRYYLSRNLHRTIGGNPHRVVLIQDEDQPTPAGQFVATVNADQFRYIERHDPMMYDDLANALAGADSVVIACHPDRRLVWAHALKGANIQGEIVVAELAPLAPLGIGACGPMPTVVVASGPLDWSDRFQKRAFDTLVSLTALAVLMPVLLVIAVLIRLDSPGPILFKQVRIGRGNKLFTMLKFRSMRVDGCDTRGERSTSRSDDRVTRVGAIIRRTSIDELPQLFNVLSGDMSIVGPRPHALASRAAEKLFWEVDDRYWHRHATKPGVTGLAQVRGFRGNTVVEDDLVNRLQADLEYLENWSILRDVKIILMTFGVLLHKNAY